MCDKATYDTPDGPLEVPFDGSLPCTICGLPVRAASMGGTAVCPWCDMGIYRDGTKWGTTRNDAIRREAQNRARAQAPPGTYDDETYGGGDTYKV